MDRHNVFIIDETPLIEAIRKYGKGFRSKDYEYAVSIYMKRKLEEIYNTPFCIAFDIKNGKNDTKSSLNLSSEETIHILRNVLLQDTPVDFALVKGTVNNPSKEAFAFQVKRYLIESPINVNQKLLEYINKILEKFRPGEASLIIVPSFEKYQKGSVEMPRLDIKMLRKNIVVPEGSFKGVFVMFYDEEVKIRQLWPLL